MNKKYLAKPIVETKAYDKVEDVLPLLDASTHKVKVEKNGNIVGKLKLKETACIIDGKVTTVKIPHVKKLPKFSLPSFQIGCSKGTKYVGLGIISFVGCLLLAKIVPCLALVLWLTFIVLLYSGVGSWNFDYYGVKKK